MHGGKFVKKIKIFFTCIDIDKKSSGTRMWKRIGLCILWGALLAYSTAVGAYRHIQLEENSFVNIIGPITTSLTDSVIHHLHHPLLLESIEANKTVTFFINSPGGSVHAGTHLLQYMRALQEQDVIIQCIAENFMSMAFVLFQACDVRMITPHSIGMQHQMSFSLRGEMETMRTTFQMHDAINDQLIAMETEKIQISREEYDQKVAHDWWIVGPHNVEEKTADEVVVYSCAPSLYDKIQTRHEKRGSYSFLVQHHHCPLYKNVEVSDTQYSYWYDVARWGKEFFLEDMYKQQHEGHVRHGECLRG